MESIHEIKYSFLHCKHPMEIINSMYPNFYDTEKPEATNRLLFLKKIEADDRFDELNKMIKNN